MRSAPVSCGRARRRQSQLFVTLLAGVRIYNRIIGKRKEPRHYRAPWCLHSFYGPRWHHPSAESRGCRVTAVLKTEAAASLGGCNFQRGDEILFFVRVAASAERGRGSEAIPMSSHCVSGRAGGRVGILRAPGCRQAQRGGLGASEKKTKLAFWHFCRQSQWRFVLLWLSPAWGWLPRRFPCFGEAMPGAAALGMSAVAKCSKPWCCVALVPAEPGESQQETQEAEKDDKGQVAVEGRSRRLWNLLVQVHGGKYRGVVGVVLDGCVQVITEVRCVFI